MADAAALVELGGAQLARGETDAAFETARTAVAAAPLDPSTLWFAANAAEAVLSPDCLSHWTRLSALVPDIAIVAIRHAHAALAANDPVLAREVLERLAARPAALAGATPELRMQAAYSAQRAGALALAAGFARAVPGGTYHADLLDWLDAACRDVPKMLASDTDLLLACVAWGEEFAGIFAKLTLPTLLAPGNLPSLVEGRRASLLMIGDAAFRARLEADPATARLDALVRRVHVEIPAAARANLPAIDVYGPVQILAFEAAKALGCDLALLHADLVYADGALAFLRRTGESGALAFCTQAFSAKLEPVAAALAGQQAVAPRRLMSLAFDEMHPRSAAMVVRADRPSIPSHATLFLFADPAGVRLRALQPSPMWVSRAVWPASLPLAFDTQDNGLIHRLVPDPADLDRIVFGADSDDFAIVEVTSERQGAERTSAVATGGAIDAAIAGLAVTGRLLDPLRLRSFRTESFLHGEASPPWADAPDPKPLIGATESRLAAILGRHR
ncbi:MAG: hypothetical protein JNL71_14220 [Rhodospirillales bacterium]|nr:hypothetical protein [Rhodospirillales bacterium]